MEVCVLSGLLRGPLPSLCGTGETRCTWDRAVRRATISAFPEFLSSGRSGCWGTGTSRKRSRSQQYAVYPQNWQKLSVPSSLVGRWESRHWPKHGLWWEGGNPNAATCYTVSRPREGPRLLLPKLGPGIPAQTVFSQHPRFHDLFPL